MRFSELHLIRYGQFDGCQLDFPDALSDLHVVFGPNEAGKSTTMSAISDLLFGFPHAAAYDFQFDKTLLRVGAVMQGGESALPCRRRRGNTRTFLGTDDQPLDETALTALLGGQSRESFLRGFSMDHARLREGGRAILEAKDDVGQAIFAAGAGMVGVVKLIEALDEQAKLIWTRTGSSRLYHAAQRAHDEAKSRLKESQTKSNHWGELKKTFERLDGELTALRAKRDLLQTGLQAAERKRRILGPMARRQHLLDQLAQLGAVRDLPRDAEAVLADAVRDMSEGEARKRIATDQAVHVREQLSDIKVDVTLLGRRAQASELRSQMGAIDKAAGDLPALKARAVAASEQVQRLVREVGWPAAPATEIQSNLPTRPQLSEVRALLEEQQGLDAALKGAANDLRDQAALAETLEASFNALPELAANAQIETTLAHAKGHGDLDGAIRLASARRDRATAAVQQALDGLPGRWMTTDEVSKAALPHESLTDRLAEELEAAIDAEAVATAAVQDLEAQREHRDLRRSQLVRHEHAISLDMLEAARRERDATMSALSQAVSIGAVANITPAEPQRLADQIREADALSDRRFDAAETSAALQELDRDIESLDLSIRQARGRIEAATMQAEQARSAWSAAVDDVLGSLSPAELTAWRTGRTRLLDLVETERVEAREVARLEDLRDAARKALIDVLPADLAVGLLSDLITSASGLAEEARTAAQKRSGAKAKLEAAREGETRAVAKSQAAEANLAAWRGRWDKAVVDMGFEAGDSLALIRARIDLVEDIRAACETLLTLERRIADIGADAAAFAERVASLAADFGVGEGAEPSAALSDIEKRLEETAKLAERAQGLNRQLSDAEAREGEAIRDINLARSRLEPLFTAASVQDVTALAEAIARSQTARTLRSEVDDLTAGLLETGDGLSLEVLIDQASGADAGALAVQCQAMTDELSTLVSDIERSAAARQAAKQDFEHADDRPDAALAAADLAQARAEMEAQAEAYVRVRAEAALLRWTVERYRREKQAPLLRRASETFAELTLGRYIALSVDLEDGSPRLFGIKADGATVVPVRVMSEGTIDQVFLSLRLAAVEESVATGVKLPFLADDLFINYDDERSAAGFRVLAKLAEKTQVLFFTHHEHLAKLAQDTLMPAVVSTCRLGETKMAAA